MMPLTTTMPATVTKNGEVGLAPSEMVLLNGERFASRARFGNVKLPQSGEGVSAKELGTILLATAFLAAERACAVRLDVREKKTLFGLRKVDTLYAEPLDSHVAWPKNCLESQIYVLADKLRRDQNRHEVANIIYIWLGHDTNSPWHTAVDHVQSGMADRGALARIQERTLRILKTTGYKVTVSTSRQAAEMPLSPIFQLLEDCQRTRPYIWQLLMKQIKTAIDSRTEYNSDYGMD